jgi:hypothetical protein
MNSADAMALASGAVLTILIETLVKNGTLNRFQAFSIITTAQTELAQHSTTPAGSEAQIILQRLLSRFPPQ